MDVFLEEGVRVAPTRYGLGVFALREFQPEEMVGEVQGEIFDDPNYESDYCVEFSDGLSLEPGEPFRYLNHSCQPNCELAQVEVTYDDGESAYEEMMVYALREIEPGEQLTIDYSWPADVAIPCLCQSPNCRGWIVAEEEAHQLAGMHDIARKTASGEGNRVTRESSVRSRHHVRDGQPVNQPK